MSKPHAIGVAVSGNTAVLSVSAHDEDSAFLERILCESGWPANSSHVLIASQSLASSFTVFYKKQISIVLCESELFPGTWREMWEHISLLDDPPLLIVTSRLADDRLWAEVLHLGAYDVLTNPFDAKEVIRVVAFLGGHLKTGHRGSLQNRPTDRDQD